MSIGTAHRHTHTHSGRCIKGERGEGWEKNGQTAAQARLKCTRTYLPHARGNHLITSTAARQLASPTCRSCGLDADGGLLWLQHLESNICWLRLQPPPRTLLLLADSWLTWSGQRRRKRVRRGIFSVFAVPVFVCVKQRWLCPPGVQRYEPSVGVRRIGFDVLPPAGYGFNNMFSLPGSHILTFGQQGCKSHCDLPQVTIWLKGSVTCFPQVTIWLSGSHSNK